MDSSPMAQPAELEELAEEESEVELEADQLEEESVADQLEEESAADPSEEELEADMVLEEDPEVDMAVVLAVVLAAVVEYLQATDHQVPAAHTKTKILLSTAAMNIKKSSQHIHTKPSFTRFLFVGSS